MPRTFSAGKCYPLNMRTTREIREKLESAAKASGRSLVQEVEFRLMLSFERDQVEKQRAEQVIKLHRLKAESVDEG